jgi:hypothetical protein
MQERTANAIASGIVAAAVVGAGYVIWRNPPLRRMAAGLLLATVTGSLPAWFGRELQEAWAASGRPRQPQGRAAI